MSQKRQERGEGTPSDEKRPRKSRSLRSVVVDVMHLRKLQSLMEPVLEPLIRRVVKEEVETALRNYIITMKQSSSSTDESSPQPTNLRLQFLNDISLPVFTGTRIEGKGCSSLEIALIDVHTGNIVSTGHGSSSQVEIVALEGDFDWEDNDKWTIEDFRSNVVKERVGKKPLLSGEVRLSLENGKGSVGDVMFTDNSSWTRSRRFRLGARIVDGDGKICIREARSEPFIVRDHRGELYKKHHPPSLTDEVWRLEKIGKDGAFHKRLRKEKVNTVEDFLVLHCLDPARLRKILGNGMSAKMWEVAVEHAQTCVLGDKLYLYNAPQKKGVVFNIVGQVKGTLFEGHFVPFENLSEDEKEDARQLVVTAFQNREKIVDFNDASTPTSSNQSNFPYESEEYNQDMRSEIDKPAAFLAQSPPSPGFISSVYSMEGLGSFVECLGETVDHLGTSYDGPLTYPGNSSSENDFYFEGTDSSFLSSNFDALSAFMPFSNVAADKKAQKGWTVRNKVVLFDKEDSEEFSSCTAPSLLLVKKIKTKAFVFFFRSFFFTGRRMFIYIACISSANYGRKRGWSSL